MNEAKFIEVKTITHPHNDYLPTKQMHRLCPNGGLYRITKNEERIDSFFMDELIERDLYYVLSEKDYGDFIPDENEFGWVMTYEGLHKLCNEEGFIVYFENRHKMMPQGKPEYIHNETLTEIERNPTSIEETTEAIEKFKKYRREKREARDGSLLPTFPVSDN